MRGRVVFTESGYLLFVLLLRIPNRKHRLDFLEWCLKRVRKRAMCYIC